MVEKEKETFLGKRSDCIGPGESKEPDPAAPRHSPPQPPPLREWSQAGHIPCLSPSPFVPVGGVDTVLEDPFWLPSSEIY